MTSVVEKELESFINNIHKKILQKKGKKGEAKLPTEEGNSQGNYCFRGDKNCKKVKFLFKRNTI